MATTISTKIYANSNCGVQLTLKDSASSTVAASSINSITYCLTNKSGTEVNGRTDVTVSVANPVTIELTEKDTVVSDSTAEYGYRLLTVSYTYSDANLGTNTHAVREYQLNIINQTNPKSW